jgi:hypothetical protein
LQLHPVIAALRSDDAPQRQAQAALFAALAGWRGSREVAAVLEAVAAYGGGAVLDQCPPLAHLFAPSGAAAGFAASFADMAARALAAAPLGHVPLRHFTDGAVSTLLLARSERAALFLSAVSGPALAGQKPPVSVSFAASEAHEAVLGGSARADMVTLGADGLELSGLSLAPGTVLARDCTREALVLREVTGTLVSLRLQRRTVEPAPTREVELASGRLIHQAASTAAESRTELMVALLGRMGRADAAPVLAGIAREPGPAGLRWQALRECLALDTATGFAALCALAGACDDALAAPAGALRAQLIEAHPQLAELVACPA